MTKTKVLLITFVATIILAFSAYTYVRGADRRALKNELEIAATELAQLRTRYGEENRRVKEQVGKVSSLEQRLAAKK